MSDPIRDCQHETNAIRYLDIIIEKKNARIAELEADLEIAKDSRAIVDQALHERRVQVEALLVENQRLRELGTIVAKLTVENLRLRRTIENARDWLDAHSPLEAREILASALLGDGENG